LGIDKRKEGAYVALTSQRNYPKAVDGKQDKMTKKDYELIAETLSGLQEKAIQNGHIATYEMIVENLATSLETDNPRFDRDLFFRACGVAF